MDDDDHLYREVSALFSGHPTGEIIPILIVVAARVLVLDAGNNSDKLKEAILRFNRLMAEEALEMFSGRHQHVN